MWPESLQFLEIISLCKTFTSGDHLYPCWAIFLFLEQTLYQTASMPHQNDHNIAAVPCGLEFLEIL
jgi:hypothetical protein